MKNNVEPVTSEASAESEGATNGNLEKPADTVQKQDNKPPSNAETITVSRTLAYYLKRAKEGKAGTSTPIEEREPFQYMVIPLYYLEDKEHLKALLTDCGFDDFKFVDSLDGPPKVAYRPLRTTFIEEQYPLTTLRTGHPRIGRETPKFFEPLNNDRYFSASSSSGQRTSYQQPSQTSTSSNFNYPLILRPRTYTITPGSTPVPVTPQSSSANRQVPVIYTPFTNTQNERGDGSVMQGYRKRPYASGRLLTLPIEYIQRPDKKKPRLETEEGGGEAAESMDSTMTSSGVDLDDPTTCQICQRHLPNYRPSTLLYHVHRHAPLKRYHCQHCDYMHNEGNKVRNHMYRWHNDSVNPPRDEMSTALTDVWCQLLETCFPLIEHDLMSVRDMCPRKDDEGCILLEEGDAENLYWTEGIQDEETGEPLEFKPSIEQLRQNLTNNSSDTMSDVNVDGDSPRVAMGDTPPVTPGAPADGSNASKGTKRFIVIRKPLVTFKGIQPVARGRPSNKRNNMFRSPSVGSPSGNAQAQMYQQMGERMEGGEESPDMQQLPGGGSMMSMNRSFSNAANKKMKKWEQESPVLALGRPMTKCHVCGCAQAGTTIGRLIRHARIHAPRKRFACPYCEYTSNEMTHMRTHISFQHHEQPLEMVDRSDVEMKLEVTEVAVRCFPEHYDTLIKGLNIVEKQAYLDRQVERMQKQEMGDGTAAMQAEQLVENEEVDVEGTGDQPGPSEERRQTEGDDGYPTASSSQNTDYDEPEEELVENEETN